MLLHTTCTSYISNRIIIIGCDSMAKLIEDAKCVVGLNVICKDFYPILRPFIRSNVRPENVNLFIILSGAFPIVCRSKREKIGTSHMAAPLSVDNGSAYQDSRGDGAL